MIGHSDMAPQGRFVDRIEIPDGYQALSKRLVFWGPMATIRKTLTQWLGHPARIAVLGVGSEIRADDAAGLLIVRFLKKTLASIPSNRFAVFEGGPAPENLTGEIIRFAPSHVLIVDAADIGVRAGAVRIIAKELISEASFSTHRLSLLMLIEYLAENAGCKTMVLGIQPKTTGMLDPVSRAVERNVHRLGTLIADAIRDAAGK
jgi:hydrogenase 3 maturation protease